jgi:hypothetical protein
MQVAEETGELKETALGAYFWSLLKNKGQERELRETHRHLILT